MKKIYTIVFLAIAAMAAFSCNKEIKVDGNAAQGPKVVVASTDQDVTPDTKTSLSGVTVLWKSTDAVKAISADGATVTSSRTSVNETGKKAEFTFDGLTVADDILLLAYPAEAVSALEAKANTVTASIPTVQTATPDSFADGANVAVAAGQVEVPVFRNIGGLLSLKVNNEGIASVKLLANEPLTGGSAVISAAAPYDVQLTGGAGEVELTGGLENGQTYYAVVYPGSYTGLRIGVSMAKGVAYGRGVPLIAVPTLKLIVVPLLLFREDLPDEALFVPMIDARRMEVYAAVYDRALREVRGTQADIVDASTYAPFLDQRPVCFFGPGAAKCKDVIHHPNAIFIDDIHPQAKYMQPLAERKLWDGDLADVAYFEPFYLKEFVATKPKDLLHSLNH